MKRYIVFLKQVPQSTRVEIDPITKTLKRSSALCKTNPDDLCALQAALNLKKKTGAGIVAVSMGPAKAENVLREALQHGADRAILLSSRAFAGSDTWCTSTVLAAAVRKIGSYDILFFGRMAIDGDTAQVGPEVAGQLDIPQITQLIQIDSLTDNSIILHKKAGETIQQLEITLPCTVIVCWDKNDLNLSSNEVGLYASPTKVVSTQVPQSNKSIEWLTDATNIMQIIQESIHPQK